MDLDQKKPTIIKQIEKKLNQEGFVCVSYGGMNGESYYHFLHKESGEYVNINDNQAQDDEELWNLVGVDEEQIKTLIEERKKTLNCYTTAEMDKKVGNWEDEDYKKVIQDLIKSNEEVIKDE